MTTSSRQSVVLHRWAVQGLGCEPLSTSWPRPNATPAYYVVKLYQVWYESDTIEHAMIVSDNWTVLLPSTFAYALRSHRDYS